MAGRNFRVSVRSNLILSSHCVRTLPTGITHTHTHMGTHGHTHTHTRSHTHTHTHTRSHTHTHTRYCSDYNLTSVATSELYHDTKANSGVTSAVWLLLLAMLAKAVLTVFTFGMKVQYSTGSHTHTHHSSPANLHVDQHETIGPRLMGVTVKLGGGT